MTDQAQSPAAQEAKPNDKELNFRAQEKALTDKYERMLAQERNARLEAERLAQQKAAPQQSEEEEDDTEPYVDHKKLKKTINNFGKATKSEIEKAMEIAKAKAKEELKQEMWLENNPDFYDILQHADKFAERSPQLAKSILAMPEGFERQKLVYQNIKELGLHKPPEKQSSIQEKVDSNRRSPYYQPSSVGTPPYSMQGDFSPTGQKQAYDKMKQLQNQLRM